MSLVKSHHSNLYKGNSNDKLSLDILVKEISIHIISRHASLIVDIENKKASQTLLEHEIIKYLDQISNYKMNRDIVLNAVLNYMFGYSYLQKYIEDESVSDIDGSRYDFFMVKKNGVKEIIPVAFYNEESFYNFCKLIIIRNGGVINENDSHERVADHKYRLRINVSIKPRNISGTSLTIRKHRKKSYILSDFVKMKTISLEMELFLSKIMKTSARILIVGKGAAGKTTLLRALLNEISITERILVCESDSELYPENPNFIVQKVQKGEGNRKTSLDRLVKDGLTMSLDGYCVGEIVGQEVWDFLKAGYTDHKIYGTLHSPGIEETFDRILTMIGDTITNMSFNSLKLFISNSIDIIVYMKKFKVMSITQIFSSENKEVKYNEIFSFEKLYETNNFLEGKFIKKNNLKGALNEEIQRRIL